ncbi:MAG: acyltransferase [Sphingomonas sp.]
MRAETTRHGIAYRPEIDGVRAVAVLGVILCHAGFTWIPGGFLGVDLFFAVSGYLITAIIRADLAHGSFSIARFYERRIRRIVPALMLMLLLTIPPALWLLLPDDLQNFGESLVATSLFANNMLLLATTAYWGIDVQFKPLMHTWSLAVEEQYYLVAPLLMALAWRVARGRGVAIGIGAATILSFLACLFLERRLPMVDFFLIVPRGWEIGAGSLAALLEPRLRPLAGPRAAAMLALAGLAMAVVPLFTTAVGTPPGARTLIPVGGICLVLLFGGARDPAGRLLGWRPMTWIGLVSYSAYLYHQPAFAYLRLMSLDQPGAWAHAALIPPVFAVAWLSWRFVEQPFRDRRRIATHTLLRVSGAGTAAVGRDRPDPLCERRLLSELARVRRSGPRRPRRHDRL